MCGIFAYLNYNCPKSQKEIVEKLLTGLRRLEYRGYDSAGLAIEDGRDATETTSVVFRATGKIANLEALLTASEGELHGGTHFETHCGIAHTRWATHGPPASKNSHPHSSGADNDFLVVHNGIITNHQALRETLIRKGYVFESDTDTEVIPKLTKYLYDKFSEKCTFRQLVMEVLRQLQGAYALAFKSKHYPGELVAAKRGSPLLLGIVEGPHPGEQHALVTSEGFAPNSKRTKRMSMEFYFASDASAMVEHTKRVLHLEDDDVAHIQNGAYGIYRMERVHHEDGVESPSLAYAPTVNSAEVERTVETLTMEVEQIMKGNYDHFMKKEIHEQPDAMTQTMRGRVVFEPDGKTVQRVFIGGMVDYLSTIRRSRRIILCGCGTSYHSAIAIRSLMEELTELPVTLELASDVLDRQCPFFRDDSIIFISQSGETADTLRALEYAKSKGALCIGIVNVVGSAISRATDCGIHINAGAEIGVASTKAYTCQITAMVLLTLALSEDSRSLHDRRMEIMRGLADLPDNMRRALELDQQMLSLAKTLVNENSLLLFGRGFNYATALEGALKVKEVALLHSEGILAGEMKHGPLALVDDTLPLVVIATRDSSYVKQKSVIEQLRARDARCILIVGENDDSLDQYACGKDMIIRVPEVADCLQPLINIVPLQLLSYHLTVLRGHNVDQPRNLAKSVTVE
ncbi:Glucosamine-fructose-6-phosphate aminotransferase, isomerising [Ostreococcus tauri]|uniref:glutamine--fructose-6-phosphate transaminase (isomerizing) n=1 Tax=Ostreococcus tauri TaxID=70448 RepID=A0A090M1J0_OSTTA|nr:Glucosamine-fructose-6-phosphate aminotransferase, isomerising [Ostreococcus tauri]OUS47815.1 glutamine-fructose-6-phosphate transaminase 2 [Ostreococcus tauri]CEF98105.1 Glucosamine-fructose-6-phosphate aminotransferase, isomerising [Ostreococcus tauri]|eukprot:XP_022839084.1 Glucosamine-fructose-6-phosphate aminotransferase, isomerising [Ostreococcus tauri]